MNKVVLISLGTKLCHYRVVGTHSKYHCLTKYSKTISIISNADIQFQSCRNFYRKSVHLFRNIFDEVCLNTQEQNSDLQCDGCNVKISESVSMFQSKSTKYCYKSFISKVQGLKPVHNFLFFSGTSNELVSKTMPKIVHHILYFLSEVSNELHGHR